MQRITSSSNNRITEISKLKIAKHRKNSGMFCAEGYKLTEELLACGFVPLYCFILEETDMSKLPEGISDDIVFSVTKSVMNKLTELSTPPEIITVAKEKKGAVSTVEESFVLALDAVQDPSNLGAILRSAEAFGVNTVILGDGCCDAFSSKALRGAMGSVFRLNIIQAPLVCAIKDFKKRGYDIIGAGLDRNYKTVDRLCESKNKVLIIGNEGGGISKQVMNECDFGMYIPMSGKNESLNAAVAASIIMWENNRQNNG